MSEGRTFEQVDAMSWHDVLMISRWRSKNPPVEPLLRAIAESLGVKFSSSSSQPAGKSLPETDPATIPDPTEDIRAAFAGAKFSAEVGNASIPERLRYA